MAQISICPEEQSIVAEPRNINIEVQPRNSLLEITPVANLTLDASGFGDRFATHMYPTVISNEIILNGDEPYILYINPQNSLLSITLPDAQLFRNRQYRFLNINKQHAATLFYFEGGQVADSTIINKDSSFWVHSDGTEWTGIRS